MTKSLLICSSADTSTSSTTEYWDILGNIIASTSEALHRIPMRAAGVLSNLTINVFANTVGSTGVTATLRKNGGNGNQVVSIPANTTGIFEDNSNTDTISAGDQVCLQTVPSTSGTISIASITTIFDPTDADITYCRFALNFPQTADASVVYYDALSGVLQNTITVTTNVLYTPTIAGDFKHWGVYSSAGGRAFGTRFIKDGVDDAVNRVLLGVDVTGLLENTSDTIAITDAETTNQLHVYGGGASNPRTIDWMAISFETATDHFLLVNARTDGNAGNANDTTYYEIGGRIINNGTESTAQIIAGIPMTLSNLALRISQNSVNGSSVLTFRKNAGNGNQTVTVPSSTTGTFTDSSNTDSVADADDLIDHAFVKGGSSGTITPTFITMLAEVVTGGPSPPVTCVSVAKAVVNKFITKAV